MRNGRANDEIISFLMYICSHAIIQHECSRKRERQREKERASSYSDEGTFYTNYIGLNLIRKRLQIAWYFNSFSHIRTRTFVHAHVHAFVSRDTYTHFNIESPIYTCQFLKLKFLKFKNLPIYTHLYKNKISFEFYFFSR